MIHVILDEIGRRQAASAIFLYSVTKDFCGGIGRRKRRFDIY